MKTTPTQQIGTSNSSVLVIDLSDDNEEFKYNEGDDSSELIDKTEDFEALRKYLYGAEAMGQTSVCHTHDVPSIESASLLNNLDNKDLGNNKKLRKKRNAMSFTMIRVPDGQVTQTDSSKPPKPLSAFICRPDVVYKKILRDFRRYFINDFHSVMDVGDISKYSRDQFSEALIKYATSVFGNENIPNIDDVTYRLGTLIYPKLLGLSFLGIKRTKKDVKKIHDSLYKLSISKMDDLMDNPEIAYLLHYFISIQKNAENLINASPLSAESYRTAINLIKSRANSLINCS